MTTTVLILLIAGLALLLTRATIDLVRYVYNCGYRKGRKDGVDQWLGFEKHAEEFQKEIRYEEEV